MAKEDLENTPIICPRCEKQVKGQEIGKARIGVLLSHVKCAEAELKEIWWDTYEHLAR